MKKIILAVAVAVGFTATSAAWEFPNNPDRFPSIGLNYSAVSEEGDLTATTWGYSGTQDITGESSLLVIDTRLPLSNQFTLDFAIGGTASEQKYKENDEFAGQNVDSSGQYFRAGVRYYFSK